jgi:HK97 family phage portal protein
VKLLGLIDWMFKKKSIDDNRVLQRYEMISDDGGFYSFNGKVYESDIVRSAIRPKAKAVGKLQAKHIRDNGNDFVINPDVNMRFLLEEPNPLMTGQMFQEKMCVQLELNNNAFALIKRDELGNAVELYPMPCNSVEAVEGSEGDMFLRFNFANGKTKVVPYADVIHLRKDFNGSDLFGDSPQVTLSNLMEIVNTTDQGIIKAIKNSNVLKWILKFKQVLQPKDQEKAVNEFTQNYMDIESGNGGAAATDPRYELEQVEPKSYVPNAEQMDKTVQRIYSFFNTNDKIIQSKYNEDEWNAYHESEIEPFALQLSGEMTRKCFSRTQRGYGNSIVYEASNLQYASMKTKLELVQLVDRSIMNGNEIRRIFNMAPVKHGNEYLRRLDTAAVNDKKGKEVDANSNAEPKGGDTNGQAAGTETD